MVPKNIFISDYNLPLGIINDKENKMKFKNFKEKEIIKKSEIIIIATNHSNYGKILKEIDLSKKIIIDPWRVLGKKLLINNG